MERKEILQVIELLIELLDEEFDIGIYDKITKQSIDNLDNYDFDNLLDETDYENMKYWDYLNTRHWKNIVQEKLKETPICEGCGNKARKVFMKSWETKGKENLGDVISICKRCRVIDGSVISWKTIKEEVDQERNKELVDDMVKDVIAKKASNLLKVRSI